MLQSLVRRGRTTVLTWEPSDFQRIDEYYGTELSQWSFEQELAAPILRKALLASRLPHETLKLSVLMGKAKRMRKDFRYCFGTYNDLDLGPGAINYLHFPFLDFRRLYTNPWPTNPIGRAIWPFYIKACLWPARWDVEGIRQSIVLANSHWSAQKYINHYQAPVHRVLHPPALGESTVHDRPRREAFLSIGRVDRSKRWELLVAIIEKVRESGHDVTLTLAGSRGDSGLLAELQELAQSRPWLTLALDLDRTSMDELISTHRYGIHGMFEEHYGMAVAELVLGGCLTFVHDSGGQVEIARLPETRYRDEDDAAEKIRAVLRDSELRDRLIKEQSAGRESFTRQAFIEGFEQFLDDLEAGHILPEFGPECPAAPHILE